MKEYIYINNKNRYCINQRFFFQIGIFQYIVSHEYKRFCFWISDDNEPENFSLYKDALKFVNDAKVTYDNEPKI